MDSAIRTWNLTKGYRGRLALRNVDLDVPRNVVFGYLGPNGAGKTTTIRLLAGLLRPTTGRCEIMGADTVRQRELAQRHLGYLPGEFVAYPDLTAEQYLRYIGNLRGGLDWRHTRGLAERLDLDLSVRVGTMSHGNRQKIGIVQAFMHRPEVFILDEPTAGLDPLIQHEFVELLREVRQAGATVFLSSHILYEVESVADMVGIVRAGRLIVVETIDRLKKKALRRIDLTFDTAVPLDQLRTAPGVLSVSVTGATAQLAVEGSTADLLSTAAPYRVSQIVTHEPDLEEIFMTYYGRQE